MSLGQFFDNFGMNLGYVFVGFDLPVFFLKTKYLLKPTLLMVELLAMDNVSILSEQTLKATNKVLSNIKETELQYYFYYQ